MKKLFEAPIRAQLFLMAVFMVLPAAAIILHSGLEAREEAISRARNETRALVDTISYQQQSLVASARQLLTGLAQIPEIRMRHPRQVQPILSEILALNPQYLNITISDRQGNIWVSAAPSSVRANIADRRHFINAMASGRFSSGEAITSRLLGIPTLCFAYPFTNEHGEWEGLIAVNLDLRFCDELLAASPLPAESSFLLTDYNGVVLGRGINPSPFLGKNVPAKMMRQMRKGPETDSFISVGYLDGIARFVTYRKLYLEGETTPYMYVRAGIPMATILSQANMALFFNLALLSSVLLFGVGTAWVIGKRSIVERVTALQTASQRLAGGDFQVRVSDIVKGGELGSLGRSFDIMAAELYAQQESLERKALVLENMAEGVMEFTRDGKIVFTNRAFDAMFGYGTGELLGKETDLLLEAGACESFPMILRHLVDHPLWCGELHNRRKDGSSFHTCARVSEIPGTGCFVSVQEDITEGKKLEQLKDEMISTVSHEMRTPLTVLLGYTEFLLETDVDNAALKDSLATMHKETNRLDQMIGNFLDLQRMQAQKVDYAFVPLGIGTLIDETADLFANASRNRRILVDYPPNLPPVSGDEMRLRQVMTNLMSNAVKYSRGRGDIVLGARREGNYVTLWVKDSGIGIPPEALDKIFERFYRVDNSKLGHFPGTGLGLALVREIVESHGGTVRADSAPGAGSTFYVSLPVAPAEPARIA